MNNQELSFYTPPKLQQKLETDQNTAGDIQEEIQQLQGTAQRSMLDIKLEQQRTVAAAKAMSPTAGQTGKQMGIAKATVSKNPQVETARRIARTLAANGPISIDDVTAELIKQGYEPARPSVNDKPRVWKGAVFRSSEWVCVGEENARLATSHARPNKLWALKSWLQTHSMNGRRMKVSRFDIEGIRRDFEKSNPNIPKGHCQWFIGQSELADDVKLDICQAKNTYDGVPVTFVEHAVGAIIQFAPPLIKQHQLADNQPAIKPTTYNSNQ